MIFVSIDYLSRRSKYGRYEFLSIENLNPSFSLFIHVLSFVKFVWIHSLKLVSKNTNIA